MLELRPDDANVVQVLEDGLKSGKIAIPGVDPATPDGFEKVDTVTSYLNTVGVTVADRIRNQFTPLFDPATEPLSEEALAINGYVQEKAGYSLYDAQLAVAEATKRQLARKGTVLIIAECGSGKTKIGADPGCALWNVGSPKARPTAKILWAGDVPLLHDPEVGAGDWENAAGHLCDGDQGITDLNKFYALYEAGEQSVYAVFSKEKARDGCVRYPTFTWNQWKKGVLCPDCLEPVEMEISEDGTKYMVNADQFFFLNEHKKNHKCPHCGPR